MVHNGIPFDVAFSLDEYHRAAYSIICSGFHGNEFDWGVFDFKRRD